MVKLSEVNNGKYQAEHGIKFRRRLASDLELRMDSQNVAKFSPKTLGFYCLKAS